MTPVDTQPTYRTHHYVIDQHGQALRLTLRRMAARADRQPYRINPTQTMTESERVRRVIDRWVDRYCQRHDLLQINDVWLSIAAGLGDPLDGRRFLHWHVLAVARDRRIDKTYRDVTKVKVPYGTKLLEVIDR